MLHHATIHPNTLGLLKKIMAIPELADFNLAGGTSLALQIGHRISVDLDFFGARAFETMEILDLLADFAPLNIISQAKNILILNVKGVKVDFVNYRYPLLEEPLIEEGIRLLRPADIGAMKLMAIAGRGRKRDFFDLYFLLNLYTLDELVQFYLRKYHDGSELMVARSLTYFDDADEDDDFKLLSEQVSWEKVKKTILKAVRKKYK